ncbi:neurochondrin isoform X1 [Patella vulgata]|uniref:neurochondrin isoform X1 n=2 Tax=Patella vulgata TaxID=6465 RepID=UPI0024A7CA1B|nr:neurochondrin isoform X1 [Patella vulgata]
MADSNVETCLRMLRSAKSDNEKFANILMVTKVIKAENCDSEMKLQIADAIGFKFLARLLRSSAVPEGCPPTIYKTVALTILSTVCTDPQVASKPEMKNLVSPLNEIIISPPRDELEEIDRSLLSDCYSCLYGMAGSQQGQLYLIQSNTVACLIQVIVEQLQGEEQAMEILMLLAGCHGNKMWTNQISASNKLISHLTTKFSQNKDSSKFELCSTLASFISTIEKVRNPTPNSSPWLQVLISTLVGDIKNKLGIEQRQCILLLVSEVVEKFSVLCLLPPFTTDVKTILLVTHLVCIEVRMILENCTWQQIQSKTSLLCSCYMLLENIISHMTTGQPMGFEEKQVLQVHSAMVGAFNGIIFFLDEISVEKNLKWVDPVVTATVRVLGAWLAEETTALKESVYKLLPFLVQLIKLSVNPELVSDLPPVLPSVEHILQECDITDDQSNSLTDSDSQLKAITDKDTISESKDNQQNNCADKLTKTVRFSDASDNDLVKDKRKMMNNDNILQFLLPGLCHLSSEDEPRKILIENNIQDLLFHNFVLKWTTFIDDTDMATDDDREEVKDSLASLCGVFLNFAVTEPNFVSRDEKFHSLLNKLYTILPQIVYRQEDLVLTANFTTLGLMLLQHQNIDTDNGEERKKFISSCLSFFSHAFHVDEKKKDCPVLDLSEEYQKWWTDIAELWFLGVQALSACIKVHSDIPDVILQSGWLVNLIKMLLDVKGVGVDDDVKTVLLELLVTLSTQHKQSRNIITEKHGIEIARIYKSVELKNILSSK